MSTRQYPRARTGVNTQTQSWRRLSAWRRLTVLVETELNHHGELGSLDRMIDVRCWLIAGLVLRPAIDCQLIGRGTIGGARTLH